MVALSDENDFCLMCICTLWSLKVLCLLFCLSFGLFSDIICVSFGFAFIFFYCVCLYLFVWIFQVNVLCLKLRIIFCY